MSQFGEILGLSLQGTGEEQETEAKTLLEFLRERMDGADRLGRRKTLAERLGLKGMGCCGATWGITIIDDDGDEGSILPPQEEEEEEEEEVTQQIEIMDAGRVPPEANSDPGCNGPPVVSGMNLADALAAERHFRAANDSDGGNVTAPETPLRVSLMRLLEETDGGDGEVIGKEVKGDDLVCCVCMGRKKGAAFIPCGHTFCRVCSRELWLNRGSCPLCNRRILEILDIF